MQVAFAGEKVGEIYEGQRYFDLVVRYDPIYRSEMERIKGALMALPNGNQMALKELANIRSVSSPNTISRENVQRKIVVSANVQGRDLRGAVNEIKQTIASGVRIPEGYRVEYGGQFES